MPDIDIDFIDRESDLFEIREYDNKSWWWVKQDVGAWKYLTQKKHYTLPTIISNFVEEKKLVVQAGGHSGLYPKQYAEMFEKVYTFEPYKLNFFCLDKNVKNENVKKYNTAIGEELKSVSISHPDSKKHNTGVFSVSGLGDIPMITIDSLDIPDCSLIHYDLEGYELFALKGAVNTINKYKPIIALETNDSCENFGYSLYDLEKWIDETLNYKVLSRLRHDTVYGPR
jgi:FkbM family methyltransferase